MGYISIFSFSSLKTLGKDHTRKLSYLGSLKCIITTQAQAQVETKKNMVKLNEI